jgi:haloalkane dehalogenase
MTTTTMTTTTLTTTTSTPAASEKGRAAPPWLDRDAYPFTLRTMSLAEGSVSYVDEGQGEPILFVHGTPTWSFEYRHLIKTLSAGHRCIAVDHLGFGLSDRPADFAYTPEAHARVLAAFVDRLGLDRFTLVVHDFGNPIGLPLALAQPRRVRALVVLNSWMWSVADDPSTPDMRRAARVAGSAVGRFLYRYLNFSLRTLLPPAFGDRGKLTPEIHRQYLAPFPDADGRGRVLWALARALLGSSAYFDSLWQRRAQLADLPALIAWGLRDRALPPSMLARWREALPQARVLALDTAGHWPHEEAPAEVAAQIAALSLGALRGTPTSEARW